MEVRHADPESDGEVSMSARGLPMVGLLIAAAASVGWLVYVQVTTTKNPEAKKETRVTQRSGKIVAFKSADEAASYGITAEPVKLTQWHPRLCVDGRVLPNPNATLEVRAPFGGVIQTNNDTASFRLGAKVTSQQTLALFEARFSPLEKLDFKAKSDAEEVRYHTAEQNLKLKQARMKRLEEINAAGAVSRADHDNASWQLLDATMQKEIALTQWNIWKQALESSNKKNIIVPIRAPIAGEIAEIGAQPGANVEAGNILLRIVDFRRVLVRLDFPVASDGSPLPASVELETPSSMLEAPTRWQASLRGAAPSIESGLQKAAYLYEIMPRDQGTTPTWRPGLYVKAMLPDPGKTSQSAVAIPAAALLVHQGRTLVYIQKPRGRFERCEVQVLARDGDTIYVSSGLRGDELVVSKHAQIVLSEEFRSDVDDD
jgi:RND family efflux transporter MFP subunit